jgi:hypothetical protein
MNKPDKYAEAPARLMREREGWLWVVDRCPLCGSRHAHGGGALSDDPYRLLGPRAAHCTGGTFPGGYLLVEARR